MSKLFYTTKNLSAILNLPVRTICSYAKADKIKSSRLQNRYIFTKDNILRYAKNNLPAECFKQIEKQLEANHG